MRSGTILGAVVVVTTGLAMPALPMDKPKSVSISAHPLKGGVYWVEGGVCNTGFIVGDRGVVVIDAQKSPEDARKVLEEIAKVTSKPVAGVVISHADPDHVGGLPAYPVGSAIIAQENTKTIFQASIADHNGGPL